MDLRQVVAAFGEAPVAVMALGLVDGEPLTARACWGAAAVLVTQDDRGWRFARCKATAMFRGLVAITPDTPAAGGVPVHGLRPSRRRGHRHGRRHRHR